MTKYDVIIARLDGVVERLDSTNERLDSTNTQISNTKRDLCSKINDLKDDFDTQFSNHLSEHKQFKERTFKVVKWILAPSGFAGIVIAVLKLLGVF